MKEEQTEGQDQRGSSPPPSMDEWAGQSEAGCWYLREAGGKEAEGLALIGGER